MGRPRTPATVLELRGSFKKDPQRKRIDAEGAGAFERDPPTHLEQEILPAWRYIVDRLPKVSLTSSDEVCVEVAARCLAGIWKLGVIGLTTSEFKRLVDALGKALAKLGMTPVDRTRIPPAEPHFTHDENRFTALKASSQAQTPRK